MTAASLLQRLSRLGITVTVVESSQIGTIGVGSFVGLFGSQGFVTDTAHPGTNNVLAALSKNLGNLQLRSGAVLSTNTDFTNLGTLIARGEVVVVDEKFGVRITEVVSKARRLATVG